jgi:putative inorganic carbon (HCO3(-)) transporter
VLFSFIKAMTALKKNATAMSKGTAFASLMAYVGMLIHMTVDFPLLAPASAVYFVIFVSLPMISSNIIVNKQTKNNSIFRAYRLTRIRLFAIRNMLSSVQVLILEPTTN